MLRHTCTTNFIERHPKAIVLQSAPFGLAIDIKSGKGVVASSNNVYNFKLLEVFCDDVILEWATVRTFLRFVLPRLSCYAIGTKNNPRIVKLFFSDPRGSCDYEIHGEIKK
jgi:hypothetical protein